MTLRAHLRRYVPMWRSIEQRLADRALRKRIAAAPPRSIAVLDENVLGRLTGVVAPFRGAVLRAPLSDRECVYWTVQIWAWGSDHGPRWILAEPADAVAFSLEEQGHRAIVVPDAAVISTDLAFVTQCNGPFDASPEERALLAAEKLLKRNWWDTSRLEFREGVLCLGAAITVVGAGVREPDPDGAAGGAYRSAGQTRLRLTGSKRRPLWISDQVTP